MIYDLTHLTWIMWENYMDNKTLEGKHLQIKIDLPMLSTTNISYHMIQSTIYIASWSIQTTTVTLLQDTSVVSIWLKVATKQLAYAINC